MISARVAADQTSTFPRFLDLGYPNIERGDGVWLFTTTGEKILDACSGGAMVSTLGHGAPEIIDAGARQAEKIAYFYMDHFTNEPQEALAERLIVVAPGMARVRFASSGSEANETALRLARAYHVDRGEASRWRVISPAQAYHGSTMATLALTGRGHTLQEPYAPYLSPHLHIAPSTWRFDPTGQAALDELHARLPAAGSWTACASEVRACSPTCGPRSKATRSSPRSVAAASCWGSTSWICLMTCMRTNAWKTSRSSTSCLSAPRIRRRTAMRATKS